MKSARAAITRTAILILLVALAFAAGWFGRSRVGDREAAGYLSPAEFAERAQLVGSIQDANFLDVAYGRAYLREWTYWPLVGERTRLRWTEANGLPPEVLRKLEAEEAREAQAASEARRP